ncbi:MAG: hypothetical protein OXR62_04810 [Ahrensia sp.]|nr:hypothetical protein [Ahrensia sp.]
MSNANRSAYRRFLEALAHPAEDGFANGANALFAPDARINLVHPFNEIDGPSDYVERFLKPLNESFAGLYRRDYICMAGRYNDGEWISSTGYWCGRFVKDWLGIRGSNALAWLRVGEFHRFEAGKVVESHIFLDIPELMIACGQWPDIASPASEVGYTGMLPGPATQDGLLWEDGDVQESAKSFKMVVDMLLRLATADEAWRPYWHDNMMWYGPAAFGSFVGIESFRSFQVPFEGCFSHWKGGAAPDSETSHFTRFGDGLYVCSGGWPSLNAHQIKPFLSQPATDKVLYMRVCDWWRREGDLLVENWVFVDIPHVLLQMGYDLFARIAETE